MKKLLFSHNGVEYYLNGHSNHRMKVRRIAPEDIRGVFENPIREENRGYGTLIEGFNEQGQMIRVFYRQKPKGYREILTTVRCGWGNKNSALV